MMSSFQPVSWEASRLVRQRSEEIEQHARLINRLSTVQRETGRLREILDDFLHHRQLYEQIGISFVF